MGWGSGHSRRSSKRTGGERPRRATQISVGKIGSGQIPSRPFLFGRASNLAWVSGHFAARPKLVLIIQLLTPQPVFASSILSQYFIIET